MRRALSPSALLPAGTRVADRFEVEAPAGSGGMGDVYRALDLRRGGIVALKILRQRAANLQGAERFTQEANLLAELRHPGVVSYVAHGEAGHGQLYLAMEWLEGEDLAKRLARGPLSVEETRLLLRRTAEALEAAHRIGIVHRDLKPHNLFLRDGEIDRVTLLDFGVARRTVGIEALTHAGRLIGTPGYMAPEQVRGDSDVGPAADVFSLGCVIHECLAGSAPFAGEHVAAVLARILFEDPRSLRSLEHPPPEPLVALIDRMLAKNPARRPKDATALLREIEALGEASPSFATPTSTMVPIVFGEQEVCSVLLAVQPGATSDARTLDASDAGGADDDALVEALARLGASVERLPDGALVAAVTRGTSAADRAEIAAHAALLVQLRWPGARVALATGRGVVRRALPVGEAVDKAARLIASMEEPGGVQLDTLSADLLEGRLVVVRSGDRAVLTSHRSAADETRLLLGKPTPCVGREQELALFDALFSACAAESAAAAALVTAPSGAGKSRLRHELLRRIRAHSPDVVVLLGRGELMSGGSPYAILGQALRAAAGIDLAQDPAVQRERLLARVAQHVPEAEQQRVAELLGEMCNVPFPAEDSVRLRAAREAPLVMNEQIRRAFIDFFRAECDSGPRLLVLEDLHWGDALGVELLEATLRELADRPLMVLALARPEVHDLFPRLRHGAIRHEIALPGLGRKASEKLVRDALLSPPPAVVERIVEQAAGNALFLEELIRAEAAGTGERSPATVLATLEVRLSLLDPEARRVLRAASVFGQTFRLSGVAALLGRDRSEEAVDLWLDRLTEEEILERRRDSRTPGEVEHRFHHSLLREAAYALLTDEERTVFHLGAGKHLEAHGERDAIVLAEHFQRGGALDRAAHYYACAAEQSYGSNDLEGTLARVTRGLACSPTGEVLGVLRQLESFVASWRYDWEKGLASAQEAFRLLPPGTLWWCKASWVIGTIAGIWGREDIPGEVTRALLATRPKLEAKSAYVQAAAHLLWLHGARGLRAPAAELLARIRETASSAGPADVALVGAAKNAEAEFAKVFDADPFGVERAFEEAVAACVTTCDPWEEVTIRLQLAQAQADLGMFDEAAANVETAASCAWARAAYLGTYVQIHTAAVLVHAPGADRADRCAALARELLATPGVSPGYRSWASTLLADVELSRGELSAAEEHARAALDPSVFAVVRRLLAVSVLARILVRKGQTDEASRAAEEGLAWLVEHQVAGAAELPVRLAVVEARRAAGDLAGAREALGIARERIQVRAQAIPDPAARERYLDQAHECRWAAAFGTDG